MDLKKLNCASRLDNYPPTKKMGELEIGGKYMVTGLKTMKTKYGVGCLATLDEQFAVFLPSRIAKFLDENPDDLRLMSDMIQKYHLQLCYHGGKFNKCEFFSDTVICRFFKIWTKN